MNEAEPKTCPLCCEPVRPMARKCPHCQHYLNKWVLAAYHPLIATSPILVLFAGSIFWLASVLHRGEDFASYRSQIHVTDTQMKFGETSKEATVAVVGNIQNDSSIPWKDVRLEVQFFDSTNKPMDAKTAYTTDIPAHDHAAFKFSQRREFPQEEYHSFVVRALIARDARSFP